MIEIRLSPGVAAAIAVLFAAVSPASHATTLASRKANDSGVAMTYSMGATPQLGQATPVVLQFYGVTHANGAAVQLSAESGLSIQGSRAFTLPSGKRTTVTVPVLSESEGRSYLNVFITQGGGRSAISVPIQTGTTGALMKPSGELQRNSRGEKIISMPAK